jgi:hypothetical protein
MDNYPENAENLSTQIYDFAAVAGHFIQILCLISYTAMKWQNFPLSQDLEHSIKNGRISVDTLDFQHPNAMQTVIVALTHCCWKPSMSEEPAWLCFTRL